LTPIAISQTIATLEAGKIAVNKSDKFHVRPLYLQVRDAVFDRIRSGRLKYGEALPSEVDLHRQLGVSLGTLRRALDVLESEQLIIREPGRGTYVRGRQTDRAYERFNPIWGDDGGPLRGRIKTGKATLGAPTGWERAALRLEAGDHVVRFERIRHLGTRAFAFERACLPERRFPDLVSRPSIPDDLDEIAQNSGVLLARAEGKVGVLAVPSEVAAALSVAEDTVALRLERVVFDTDDKPVEAMTAYYDLRNEYCRLTLR
jgi:GntR family transcriptional regulator